MSALNNFARLAGLLLVLIMSVGNAVADTDRVALMLTGGYRTFAKVWPTVEKHLAAPLRSAPGASVELTTFLCVELAAEAPTALAMSALNIQLVLREDHPDYHNDSVAMFRRESACYLHAVVAHETASGAEFTHLIRGRPDQEWHRDVPSWASLRSLDRVRVRARTLSYEPPRHVDPFFLAWKAREACPTRVEHQKAHDHMAKYEIPMCVLADDQFVVMPRHAARLYFGREKRNIQTDLSPAAAALFRDTFGPYDSYEEYRVRCAGQPYPPRPPDPRHPRPRMRNGQTKGNEVWFTQWLYEARLPIEVRPFAISNAGKKRFSPINTKGWCRHGICVNESYSC